MNKKIYAALNLILPNKKLNYFLIGLIFLGIISGSIFLTIINNSDKSVVIEKIIAFFASIDSNSLNNSISLKNSLLFNFTYILLMWILGLSLIGILINIFLLYIRGFIMGFSISCIILTYKYKGIIASFLYLFPHNILNLIYLVFICSYSIIVSKYFYNCIFNKINNDKNIIKKYSYVLIISLIVSFFSSIMEAYLFPSLLKIIIGIFV